LELASGLKRQQLNSHPLIQRHYNWLEGILNQPTPKVNFAYQTQESTVNLSGGQLQKLILLRELLRKPKILFLDESFSAIDKQSCFDLISWLKDEQQQTSFQIISIMHNRELVDFFGGVVLNLSLENGKMQVVAE
jgi:ABC-type bacteriocin/lantibiotic exporter with double-glycine peptidase domain